MNRSKSRNSATFVLLAISLSVMLLMAGCAGGYVSYIHLCNRSSTTAAGGNVWSGAWRGLRMGPGLLGLPQQHLCLGARTLGTPAAWPPRVAPGPLGEPG